jgi:hypothetical protein
MSGPFGRRAGAALALVIVGVGPLAAFAASNKPAGPPPKSPYPAAVGAMNGVALYRELYAAPNARPAPSGWMYARVDFQGRGLAGYLNLSVADVWVIQNVPLIAVGDGPQSRWLPFSPGPPRAGKDVVPYGATLDREPRAAAPLQTGKTMPTPLPGPKCGFGGGPGPTPAQGPVIQHSGPLAEPLHIHLGQFVNQQAETNQCVSVAFSNSLEWLKSTTEPALVSDDITPAGLDRIIGRQPGQAIDPSLATARKKDRFNVWIDTTTLTAGQINQVGAAIDRGCDVEMFARKPVFTVGHAVAVTGIGKLVGGGWQINIVEDLKQGPPGSGHQTVSETLTYPVSFEKLIRAPGSGVDGYKISAFVVECPRPPNSPPNPTPKPGTP